MIKGNTALQFKHDTRELQEIQEVAATQGWARLKVGVYKSKDQDKNYELYIRRRNLKEQVESRNQKQTNNNNIINFKSHQNSNNPFQEEKELQTNIISPDNKNKQVITKKNPIIKNDMNSEIDIETNTNNVYSINTDNQQNQIGEESKKTPFINMNLQNKTNKIDSNYEELEHQQSKVSNTHLNLNIPLREVTPSHVEVDKQSSVLPDISQFGGFSSLRMIQSKKSAIVIGYDCKWVYYQSYGLTHRRFISWQFSLIDGNDLVEFVFISKDDAPQLPIELALARIMDSLSIEPIDKRRVKMYESNTGYNNRGELKTSKFKSKDEAQLNSIEVFSNGKVVRVVYDFTAIKKVPIVLVSHGAISNITGLDLKTKRKRGSDTYLTDFSSIQGNLISLDPISMKVNSLNPNYAKNNRQCVYPILFHLADTKCHVPGDMEKLSDLSNVIKWGNVYIDEKYIERMDLLLHDDLLAYLECVTNDSVIPLLYISSLYGYNSKPFATITSAACSFMRGLLMEHFDCVGNRASFERKYRGMHKIKHGLIKKSNGVGFLENTSYEPISDDCRFVQLYAKEAFRGGFNGSFAIGFYSNPTFDYDLKGAYGLPMCILPDVDWENPVKTEVTDRNLELSDFMDVETGIYNPFTLMFAYVHFDFPKNVNFPCIPVDVDGVPFYPKCSNGFDGVFASGSELYLALQLGATVYVKRGFILNPLIDVVSNEVSYSLKFITKSYAKDRADAKNICGAKSLEELIIKLMNNGGFGKIAQGVVDKHTWSASKNIMEDLDPSAVTNPVLACMITSVIRTVLFATLNSCASMNYKTYSATTDGFISEIPFDVLQSFDLYGIAPILKSARLFLTDGESEDFWEIKHCQNDLLNFSTRGNVSLHSKDNPMIFDNHAYEGVCAHNGCSSPYDSDSYVDRFWMMEQVLSRRDSVSYVSKESTGFRELCKGVEYVEKSINKKISMDFDMKRKPVRDSFCEMIVELNGGKYEIVNFTTEPFENVDEFKRYREKKKSSKCLRTKEDWERFFLKVDNYGGAELKPRNLSWAILNSCIMGHRCGLWEIPKLNELQGVERDEWINSHNDSPKKWKGSDWKNAGRKKRHSSILRVEMLKNKLEELMNG